MKITRWFLCFAFNFALLPATVNAQPIDIKGLSIGMSKTDVEQKFPNWNGFTIADVSSKYQHSPLNVSYFDGKLDSLLFFFDSNSFTTVLDAVKQKYPSISCKESQVGNPMGAKFTQIECTTTDQLSILQLRRFVSDIRTSSLSLISKRKMEEYAEKEKNKKKDI